MKKKHEQGVSRLVTSHFHLKIAERIGETDGIKALDRNAKALKKEKCYYYYKDKKTAKTTTTDEDTVRSRLTLN